MPSAPDNFYQSIVLPLAGFNANGTNTLRFLSNGNLSTADYFWIDDLEMLYFRADACFVAKVDPSNTSGAYSLRPSMNRPRRSTAWAIATTTTTSACWRR